MKRLLLHLLFWLVPFLAFMQPLYSTSITPSRLENVDVTADVIVLGKVIKVKSRYVQLEDLEERRTFNGRDKIIVTTIDLEVLKQFKGERRSVVTFELPGGCVLNECLDISLFPTLRAGERGYFFFSFYGSQELHVTSEGIFKINQDGQLETSLRTAEEFEKDLTRSIAPMGPAFLGSTTETRWNVRGRK